MQFGIGAFVLPFFFVLDPALLGEGTWLEVTWATARAALMFFLIAIAIAGFFRQQLLSWQRLLMLFCVVLMLIPAPMLQIPAFVAGAILIVSLMRASNPPTVTV